MEIKKGWMGSFSQRSPREYVSYSEEELLHIFAENAANKKDSQYETVDEFGFVRPKTHLKIGSNLLEAAYAEFLDSHDAARAAELTKKLMCYSVKSSYRISYKEYTDMRLELAMDDEELEAILANTPLSIVWTSVSKETEEIIINVDDYMYVTVSFFDDIYGKGVVWNPNFHTINKDNF